MSKKPKDFNLVDFQIESLQHGQKMTDMRIEGYRKELEDLKETVSFIHKVACYLFLLFFVAVILIVFKVVV